MPQSNQDEFSFKSLFVPLTTFKAIHIIVIVGFIVFSNMLFNGFVWDDIGFIINNNEVHKIDFAHIFGSSKFNSLGYYRVIPAYYFSILYTLFGSIAFFYHFLQLAIHIINSIGVFILFKSFYKKSIALILSILFLVHPIQVESVTFIASAGNPLFFMFGISSLILLLRNKIDKKYPLIVTFLLLLTLLSKETGVLFLVIILVYSLIFKRNIFFSTTIATIVSLAIYAYLRFSVGGIYFLKQSNLPIMELTFREQLYNIPAVLFYYIKTFFLPVELAISQRWLVTDLSIENFYLPMFALVVFLLLIIGLGSYMYKYAVDIWKSYIFFLTWLFLGLILLLPFFPLSLTVADRWFYFPIVGLLGIIGSVLHVFLSKNKKKFQIITAIFIVLIIVLSFRTIVRNLNWKDNTTLYSHDTKIHTTWSMESDLGLEFAKKGEYETALLHLNKSVNMNPCKLPLYNLGYVYEISGDINKSIPYYRSAISAKNCKYFINNNKLTTNIKNTQITYVRLARVLILADNPEEAKKYINLGLRDFPNSGILWSLLAVSEYNLQNQKEAIIASKKAKELLPHAFTRYVYTQITNKQYVDLELYLKN